MEHFFAIPSLIFKLRDFSLTNPEKTRSKTFALSLGLSTPLGISPFICQSFGRERAREVRGEVDVGWGGLAGGEHLERLQRSPLTAARHMAGPREGWALSPGKVLTLRQPGDEKNRGRGRERRRERRAPRGGNS
ncbi:hypothetical protein DPEC_G00305850 [Dallia pectoralis]|uniref:Uncharacterized protein n=1 Tax=Dallia pectoralis TaxID=75939 RepID=A0ACC2FDY7_DALPE|nr:hypothetical protein DPEC_G00305850 [Dallia pectoralis]